MNHFDRVQSSIELCESQDSSIDSITAGFRTAVEELGFRHFACCSHVDPLHPPNNAVVLHNFPAAWVRQYSEERLYQLDPVFQHAASDPAAFFWDTTFSAQTITAAQKKMLAEAATFGLEHGYTIPLIASWIPGAPRASCSVVPDSDSIDAGSYTTVHIMALYLYGFVSRLRCGNSAPPMELTPRERQCLTLVAQGKDDWTIGRVLGLSEHTVHSHVEKAKRRFRVSTRVQAVVQAVMTGQISLGDVAPRRDGIETHDEVQLSTPESIHI